MGPPPCTRGCAGGGGRQGHTYVHTRAHLGESCCSGEHGVHMVSAERDACVCVHTHVCTTYTLCRGGCTRVRADTCMHNTPSAEGDACTCAHTPVDAQHTPSAEQGACMFARTRLCITYTLCRAGCMRVCTHTLKRTLHTLCRAGCMHASPAPLQKDRQPQQTRVRTRPCNTATTRSACTPVHTHHPLQHRDPRAPHRSPHPRSLPTGRGAMPVPGGRVARPWAVAGHCWFGRKPCLGEARQRGVPAPAKPRRAALQPCLLFPGSVPLREPPAPGVVPD